MRRGANSERASHIEIIRTTRSALSTSGMCRQPSIAISLNSPHSVFVSETVFTWPGLGALYIMAIQQLDYPLIMGETMVITVMLVGATLLTDIAYVVIDPRIRLG